MPMPLGSNTGPQLNSDGSANVSARSDRLGSILMVEGRGRYAENTRRGLRMHGANQAAVTTTVALATTYTGLCLYNPIGSTVNLEIDKFGYSVVVAPAAAMAIGPAISGVTADGQYNAYANGPVGQGLIYKAATLPTAPTLRQLLGGVNAAAETAQEVPVPLFDLEGSIILTPGSYLCAYTSTASGASGMLFSIGWTEVTP